DIMMVEAGATPNGLRLVAAGDPPSDEAAVSAALEEAKPYIAGVIDLIAELASKVEKPHSEWPRAADYTPELAERAAQAARRMVADGMRVPGPQERLRAAARGLEEVVAELGVPADDAETKVQAAGAFKPVLKVRMRGGVIDEGVRLAGRGPRDARTLTAE